MKITHLKTNRLQNPLGYDLGTPTVSYVVTEAAGKKQKSANVQVSLTEDFSELVYESGEREDINSCGFALGFEPEMETRYFWKVIVTDDAGDQAESETAWFETAKAGAWEASWITPDAEKELQASVYKTIRITKPVQKVRAYMTGLGLYELYIDGAMVSDEYMLPGFCDYETWIQYQTYDLKLTEGEHRIEMLLGDGWYKGVYGMRVLKENYGDRLAAIAEIKIWYEDGTTEVICTDDTWKAQKSRIVDTGIYTGEIQDMTLDIDEVLSTKAIELPKEKLSARLSPAIRIQDRITPIEIIHTPAGETVLDMGQNMVGWFGFTTSAPRGQKLHFGFGEILQDGNFYRDNLRTAVAEFTYISNGEKDQQVRQHFTFYGYRFVKVEGWTEELKAESFCGLVLHSDMEALGQIETSDPLVNQLFHNTWWGQKGNFLDVPTDCPQRDERYGWTGDAQIFSGTACFNMDTYAFYTKFGKDVYSEQKKLNGSVPDVVPVANFPGDASTGWAEAATVIPWNVYLHYGDPQILVRQYPSMKAWVDYMKREDDADGAKRLWHTGYHYADWLALDGNYPGGVYGATDPNMIASGFYYYSTTLTAKAAAVIGKEEDAAFYTQLAEEIKKAFIAEYYTPTGRLAIDTMTAYVQVLYFGLVPEGAHEKVCTGLLNKLKRNRYHLETGFLGTPYLCRVLSDNGMNDLAYHLLMEKGYPGWLYEVLMGATTIWERWNSVNPDGKISGTEMNSLNHYSYGSIVEWMYRNMSGIVPCEKYAGYKKFTLCPKPNYQIQSAKTTLQSASGEIVSEWKLEGKTLTFTFKVPFDTEAKIVLPDADLSVIAGQKAEGLGEMVQEGKDVVVSALAGTYTFTYEPTTPYRKIYSVDSPLTELEENPKTMQILQEDYYSIIGPKMPFKKELYTLEEHLHGPFTYISKEQQKKLDARLREVE